MLNETRVAKRKEKRKSRALAYIDIVENSRQEFYFYWMIMKLVCSSSHATGLCMRQYPLCLSVLRQGRVSHNVFLKTLIVLQIAEFDLVDRGLRHPLF